ncbi:MAG: LicD family protein [Bacteroidales bacterium]|nr:LicD family protein [Bacteroidales bacterium]
MEQKNSVRAVQDKILEIMKYIDRICRKNDIVYYIMGGTALGAVRHGGFIPWDDDLDIFMSPAEYQKFKVALVDDGDDQFILQEWHTTPNYLEYAKVRMNGTTFIEANLKDRKDLHHGIYVDIMMLHKVPESRFIQRLVYYECKFVTLYALTQRNWRPKNSAQKMAVKMLKVLPCNLMVKRFYHRIYKYDNMENKFKWCYWITPANFHAGLFAKDYFENPVDVPFEDTELLGSRHIRQYLKYRYGDYMKLPSKEQQQASVHAMIFDTEKDYKEYIK